MSITGQFDFKRHQGMVTNQYHDHIRQSTIKSWSISKKSSFLSIEFMQYEHTLYLTNIIKESNSSIFAHLSLSKALCSTESLKKKKKYPSHTKHELGEQRSHPNDRLKPRKISLPCFFLARFHEVMKFFWNLCAAKWVTQTVTGHECVCVICNKITFLMLKRKIHFLHFSLLFYTLFSSYAHLLPSLRSTSVFRVNFLPSKRNRKTLFLLNSKTRIVVATMYTLFCFVSVCVFLSAYCSPDSPFFLEQIVIK